MCTCRAATGPYPTLIEYSGYGYANPAGAESWISPVANLLGYAVVDVNMRGTGCSGGAFDYFEPLQGLDGYDVIETVARKPWVLHHKVGMIGVSYGGISQLFVAAHAPAEPGRDHAAVGDRQHADDALSRRHPQHGLRALVGQGPRRTTPSRRRKSGGQKWALDRIKGGDKTCKRNQALHAEAVDLLAKVRANNYYRPKVADPLSPATFVHKINVPVFLACQWTDEQTGGHCPNSREPLHRHEPQVVHVHERRPHRLAGPGHVQPLVRLPADLRRPARAAAPGQREARRRR